MIHLEIVDRAQVPPPSTVARNHSREEGLGTRLGSRNDVALKQVFGEQETSHTMIHADNDEVLAKSLFGRHDQENIGDRNACVYVVCEHNCMYVYIHVHRGDLKDS